MVSQFVGGLLLEHHNMTKKEQDHRYYLKNKEKIIKQVKEYRINNSAVVKEYQKKKYRLNKETYLAKNKIYRVKNHKKILEGKKRYRLANKNKILAYQSKYEELQRKINPKFRIKAALRTRIHNAVRKGYKSASTVQLLGCTVKDLKNHLELQFQPNMSWSNYGEWHIDHRKPCASFDLTKESEQRKCFNYTNLQPLWAEDNLRKGAS
jgi:phage-related minor tail protein